jgi:hypothetical protein
LPDPTKVSEGRRVGGAAASAPLLAGCDEFPLHLVSEKRFAAMGFEAWQQICSEMPPTRDRDLKGALDAVAAKLLPVVGEDPAAWEVRVFASPEVNSFALPGGKIGVYEGMFELFANPHELAAVVGQDIGHLQAEHGRERITAEIARDAGTRIVTFLLNLGEVEFATEIGAALGPRHRVWPSPLRLQPGQHPAAIQLLARKAELERTGSEVPLRVAHRRPYTGVWMTPSKSKYSSGWSSVSTASRFTAGSSAGPFGTAQLFRMPWSSSRRS